MTRKVDDRNTTILQAFAFLQVSLLLLLFHCCHILDQQFSRTLLLLSCCCYVFTEAHDLLRADVTLLAPALYNNIHAEAAWHLRFSCAVPQHAQASTGVMDGAAFVLRL